LDLTFALKTRRYTEANVKSTALAGGGKRPRNNMRSSMGRNDRL
jgi:hypothetical protein